MELKDKETLVVQRANLVENINIRDGLFTQLISRKLLTQRQVRSIQNGRTIDEQVEELLDRLPTLGKQAFSIFCDALIDDNQEDAVNLYLRRGSNQASDVNKNTSVEESSSNNSNTGDQGSVSHDNIRPRTVCNDNIRPRSVVSDAVAISNAKAPSCVQARVEIGSMPTSGVAIHEEYQQQTYRRNIQPTESRIFADDKDQISQEAQHFYQNILNPNNGSFVCSVLNSAPYSQNAFQNMEKPFYGSPSKRPMAMSYNGSRLPYSCRDEKVVTDSALKSSAFHNSMSNGAIPPSIHPDLPLPYLLKQTAMPPDIQTSPFKDRNSRSFHFQTTNNNIQDTAMPSQENESVLHNNNSLQPAHFREHEMSNDHQQHPVTVRDNGMVKIQQLPPNLRDIEMPNVKHSINPSKHSHSVNARESETTQAHIERDTMELPRYIEMKHTNGSNTDRDFVSLPRYIERMHPSPTSAADESTKGEYSVISRLARNDSVDTMHKRPCLESQDVNAKRFCTEMDSMPTLVQPEQLTTLQFYDKGDHQVISIPTIAPSPRKPAVPSIVIATESEQQENYGKHMANCAVMDDPEIDLTDGPVNVKVEQTTRQFYINHYKQAYAMRRIPRGKALILNVNEVVGKSPRRGTDIDRDNLHNLLCQLHFDVTVYNDEDGLTAKEMVIKLQDFSQHMGHMTADAAVICILSHGEEGYIFGADGKKFELDGVFSLFDNTCCSALMGKPKIFIIQACRGGALDRGVVYCQDEHDGSDARVRQVPSMSDMIICYPTQHGYYAWRNRDRGSWYVEALVQVLMKFAKCEDMCTMLNRINLLVSKKVSHCPQGEMDQMTQMSEYKSTLRMPHLYFFPGIGGCS